MPNDRLSKMAREVIGNAVERGIDGGQTPDNYTVFARPKPDEIIIRRVDTASREHKKPARFFRVKVSEISDTAELGDL